MAEIILKLIPVEPGWVPDLKAQHNAEEQLKAFLPRADEVLVIVTDEIEFVDPGENLKQIVCPNCGSVLEESWWLGAMEQAAQTGYTDLMTELPCCRRRISLHDLDYQAPAGFARFILEALNPKAPLENAHLKKLEQLVGRKLRCIIADYQ